MVEKFLQSSLVTRWERSGWVSVEKGTEEGFLSKRWRGLESGSEQGGRRGGVLAAVRQCGGAPAGLGRRREGGGGDSEGFWGGRSRVGVLGEV